VTIFGTPQRKIFLVAVSREPVYVPELNTVGEGTFGESLLIATVLGGVSADRSSVLPRGAPPVYIVGMGELATTLDTRGASKGCSSSDEWLESESSENVGARPVGCAIAIDELISLIT
jgi:hypothetical protein